MAEFFVHLSQARHNESLAEYLLDKPYYDWAITACFYSAIHYFEARLFIEYTENDKKHSETSIPLDDKGEWKYTPHRWRERLVHNHFSRSTWISFRNLREASELARYLSYYPKRLKVVFKEIPSYEIFQPKNAQHSVNKDLQIMKKDLRVELGEFLHGLEMEKSDWLKASLVIHKLLDNFSSKEEILQQGKAALRQFLSRGEIDFFEQHLRSKGYEFK